MSIFSPASYFGTVSEESILIGYKMLLELRLLFAAISRFKGERRLSGDEVPLLIIASVS